MKKDKNNGTSLMMVKLASAKYTRTKSSKLSALVETIWEKFTITILSECNLEGKKDGGMPTCFSIHELIIIKYRPAHQSNNFH